MSFEGRVIVTSQGIMNLVWKGGLNWLRAHNLSGPEGRAQLASSERLCRLLRALWAVLRSACQLHPPGAVGSTDRCSVGDPLRRSHALWPDAGVTPPPEPALRGRAGRY